MSDQQGFINNRTGKYVSPERASQKVGSEYAFNGYEKVRSQTTGNFYMRKTSSDGSNSPQYDDSGVVFNLLNFLVDLSNLSFKEDDEKESAISAAKLAKEIHELDKISEKESIEYVLDFYDYKTRSSTWRICFLDTIRDLFPDEPTISIVLAWCRANKN